MEAVKAAIDELLGEIQVRQDAVDALRRLCPLQVRMEIVEKVEKRPDGRTVTNARMVPVLAKANGSQKATKKTKIVVPDGQTRTVPDMIRAVLGKLKGEFGSDKAEEMLLAKFPEEAKKIKIGIYYGLNALVKKGELKQVRRVGHSWVYAVENAKTDEAAGERPEKTNAALPDAPRSAGRATPGRTKGIVESELERALKDRDKHREEGRTIMEGIAQKRVDALEAELESYPDGAK